MAEDQSPATPEGKGGDNLAMEAIVDELKFNPQMLIVELDRLLKETAAHAKEMYLQATATWDHQPKFWVLGPYRKGDAREVVVEPMPGDPNTQIFIWVELGTDSHRIPVSGEADMRFPTEYTPKSSPRTLTGRGGGKNWDGPWARRRVVMHPGIEPRNFGYKIAGALRPWFMNRAMEILQRFAPGMTGIGSKVGMKVTPIKFDN